MKTKQKTILNRRRAHGESLREWLHDRRVAAGKRIAAETEARRARPRGVDRVPARYRLEPRPTQYVVEHTAANRTERRAWALGQGRALPAPGNTPHVNPARDRKPGARLRKEVRG